MLGKCSVVYDQDASIYKLLAQPRRERETPAEHQLPVFWLVRRRSG